MWVYLGLAIVTSIVLVLLAKQDLREQMVYAVPVILLHLIWCMYIWTKFDFTADFLVVFWSIHLVLYILFNRIGIWGAGDSDWFMLFADICLIGVKAESTHLLVFGECAFLICALMFSIFIGKIDARKKGKSYGIDTAIAATPGMAIVIIVLLFCGWIWRFVQ